MYAQLGNIRFEGLKGFSSLEESFGVNYVEHERINGKPRLQAVGDVLDTITFDMFLHADFTDPEADIEAIRLNMVNREVLPLVLGNGKVVGNFVIPSFTKSTQFTDPNGNIISATISVELLESYSDDPLRDSKKAAKNSAFATTARNNNVRTVLPPKLSDGTEVTARVSEIGYQAAIVNNYTAAAESNPNTYEYYSGKITQSLDAMEGSITAAQNRLQDAQDLQQLAESLPVALQQVYSNIQNMRGALPISDIQDFKSINNSLLNSTFTAKAANTRLAEQSIIRRK